MPEIDLEPKNYRWRRPLSLPLAWAFVALGVVMLGYIYLHRTNSDAEFVLTAMVACAVGLILAGIMRNID